jgi:hypothetical protein
VPKGRLSIAALLGVLLPLGGCSSQKGWMYEQYAQIARQSIAASLGHQRISREEAATIPYASIGYRVDDGGQSLLVLATDSNGEQLWTSKSRVVISTRDGRITRTLGLPRDIVAVTARSARSLPPPSEALAGRITSERMADFPDISAYSVPIRCTAAPVGSQTITILGNAMSVIRIDESCRSARLRWSFTDSYWIAMDNGLIWRSRQHIHPKGETVEIELFRPPS